MKTNFKFLTVFLALAMFIFTSCETTVDTDIDSQSVEDDARAQDAIGDAFAIVNGNSNDGGGGKSLKTCPEVTWTGATGSRICTINFGEGCQGADGVTRKGKIIATFSRTWGEGATSTITFENYGFDDNTLTGEILATYKKTGLQPEFTLGVTNAVLTTPDGTISWNSTSTTIMIEGADTPIDRVDDEFELNYATTGTNLNGKAFTTTGTAIHKIYDCKYPVEGTIATLDGLLLDFDEDGDSSNTPECNNKAKITKGGISVIINL